MKRDEYLSGCTAMAYAKRGEDLPQSKLTDQNIRDIRKAHEEKQAAIKRLNAEFSAKALAGKYNVHVRTIEKALSYEGWNHV